MKGRLKSLEDKMRVLKRNSRMQSRNAISALGQAYEYFQRDLAKLQRYVDVNSTGFRKILKKYDKKTKENTKELFLSTQYRMQPFFDAISLTRMSDTAMMNALEASPLTGNYSKEEEFEHFATEDERETEEQNASGVGHLKNDLISNEKGVGGILHSKLSSASDVKEKSSGKFWVLFWGWVY